MTNKNEFIRDETIVYVVDQNKTHYFGFQLGIKGLRFYEYGDIIALPNGMVYNASFYGTLAKCKAKFTNDYPKPVIKSQASKMLAEKQMSDIVALLSHFEDKMKLRNNNGKYNKIQRKPRITKIK